MDEQLSRRERKKQETRQRLMEEALRLFDAQGYEDTTVEQIAEAADVAKGTFFNYFEAKEAILPAMIQWRLQQLEHGLAPRPGMPTSPVARIKQAMYWIAEDPLSDPTLARRLFSAMQAEHSLQMGRVLIQLLARQVHQAQELGEIRPDVDPGRIGGMVWALLCQQVMMWHHGYQSRSLREMLESTMDLLLEGLAGPEWREPV